MPHIGSGLILMRRDRWHAVGAVNPGQAWVIPRVRYARSGDVTIAYQVVGDAPVI